MTSTLTGPLGRVLLLADIHGNSEALKAVLRDAAGSFGSILCLGDIVGYYPNASQVIDVLVAHQAAAVCGNHEEGIWNATAHASSNPDYLWEDTLLALDDRQKSWLASLPEVLQFQQNGHVVEALHSSPITKDAYIYPDSSILDQQVFQDSKIYLLGHTHIQMHRRVGSSILINPGSVGQPRNGKPGADYALLDFNEMTVDFRHVDYDYLSYAAKRDGRSTPRAISLLTRDETGRVDKNPCGSGERKILDC